MQVVLPPAERIRVQIAQDTASLSSSPWIQRASSVPAPSGLLSDSGQRRGEERKKTVVSPDARCWVPAWVEAAGRRRGGEVPGQSREGMLRRDSPCEMVVLSG